MYISDLSTVPESGKCQVERSSIYTTTTQKALLLSLMEEALALHKISLLCLSDVEHNARVYIPRE